MTHTPPVFLIPTEKLLRAASATANQNGQKRAPRTDGFRERRGGTGYRRRSPHQRLRPPSVPGPREVILGASRALLLYHFASLLKRDEEETLE